MKSYRISDLIRDIEADILTEVYENKEISSGYCCDMLSWAMANVTAKDCWFTILASMNVVAVATLSDCPVVVLTEDVSMDDAVVKKAREERKCIVKTKLTSFCSAGRLYEALLNTGD